MALELTLGERLRLTREHADLDQAQLGDLLGVSRQTVSNYERGIRKPKEATLLAWSIHTKTSLESIRTGSEDAA
jgi:transcriptional regulator with XRE-family HTH domain